MEEGKEELTWGEILAAKAEEAVEDVLILVKMDVIEIGDRYGFEQIFPDPDSWERMPKAH